MINNLYDLTKQTVIRKQEIKINCPVIKSQELIVTRYCSTGHLHSKQEETYVAKLR